MKPCARSFAFCTAVLLAALHLARPAAGDTVVLDGDDVLDWAHVPDYSGWKYHDACLLANALLKFDLSDIGAAAQILDARLYLYAERASAGGGIQLSHVQDDSWSYGTTEPSALWGWPTLHPVAGVAINDTGPISVDVTAHVTEERQAGDTWFSIKLEPMPQAFGVRLSSPLAPLQRMRPRLVVQYVPSSSAGAATPDLAVSTADIHFSPMHPSPGQAVTVRADVRNLGPSPATNVQVAFWDGPPAVGSFIGVATVPSIAAGGGMETVSATWNAVRGVRDIFVVADPDDTIVESDEFNNQDFRSFQVTDAAAYWQDTESFEYPGQRGWDTDFEFPKQPVYPGPRSFYLNRSGAQAYHGRHALEMFVDGNGDDGTVWIERAVPVDPGSTVDVQLDFELFRYAADIAFIPVACVGVLDPETEADFQPITTPAKAGWDLLTYKKTLFTGPFDQVFVAAGITVTWETPGTLFMDLVKVQMAERPTSVPPGSRDTTSAFLSQNRPNPMVGPLTTITYRLPREGRVSLRVYDAGGRLVATLSDGFESAGLHEVHWNGTDDARHAVPSGAYFYRLVGPGVEDSRRLLLER